MSSDLYKGFAIIIDDKVFPKENEEADPIVKIIKKIKDRGIPFCAYSTLKEAEATLDNLQSVSFIILDWDLLGDLDTEGPEIIIRPSHSDKVVKFIKKFRSVCFCPIFIFSNASIGDIKDKLEQAELYKSERDNFIYLHAKRDLIKGQKLFKTIENWINGNPAIYTLKSWESAFLAAKNDTFWNLFQKSPAWPRILWESYDEDSIDPNSNLNDAIYRLIKSRTSLTNLDEKKIKKKKGKVDFEEMKDVIQGTMYVANNKIPQNEVSPGDIFKRSGKYYINIRPECDTVLSRTNCDGLIYLLEGSKLSSAQFRKNHYNRKFGIIRNANNFLLYGLDTKDFVRFNLKELHVLKYQDLASHRVCRLISPYINDVQQQFSSYVGRFGLPRIPNRILNSIK